MKDVDKSFKNRRIAHRLFRGNLTDDWQAREILAELGSRQMRLDYGALSK